MSAKSPLEGNADLEVEKLVKMEDTKTQKNTLCLKIKEEECFVDNIYYDNECVIDDEDSKVEGVVFIKSEDVSHYNSGESGEYIVPEVIKSTTDILKVNIKQENMSPQTNRWPTLEILPGGVIKDADMYKTSNVKKNEIKDMTYTCAKCKQTYKHLFSLVKHIKWHDKEEKYKKIVIKPKQREEKTDVIEDKTDDDSNMIYACAICPRKFKKLLSLVKHVKWHKDHDKKKKDTPAKTCSYHKVLTRRKAISKARSNIKPKNS